MALCDELICAAKIIHPTLYLMDGPGTAARNVPLEKFHQECRLLCAVKHPNIVQYLGTWREPHTNYLVLLMELCDRSLTRYLETTANGSRSVSFPVQVDLCHDVSLALVYLHKNGLIHRDLSSNNVLLTRDLRAKITDFGMTRFMHHRLTPLTLCPGTQAYMPPESLNQNPHYTHKLDCFSMGVLAIQIVTLKFPDPQGERFQSIPSSDSPAGFVLQPVSEEKRRSSHISLIPSTHPFLPLIRQCLCYKEQDRPSSLDICRRMAELKHSELYRENVRISRQGPIGSGSQPQHNSSRAGSDVAAKPLTSQAQPDARPDKVEAGGRQEVDEKEKEIKYLKEKVTALQKQLENQDSTGESDKQPDVVPASLSTPNSTPSLCWHVKGEAPHEFTRGGAVVLADSLFCHSTAKNFVSRYDLGSGTWTTLPRCSYSHFSLAAVNGELTVIGGFNFTTTNKLFTFTEGSSTDKGTWVKQLEPMPTARCNTACVCTDKTLVVAGGDESGYNNYLNVVEVMDVATGKWTEAARLPKPCLNLSATICSGQLYVAGGITARGSTKSYSCSMSDLLAPPTRGLRFKPLSQAKKVWQEIKTPPAAQTTLATFTGRVLALGGQDHQRKPVAEVYMYDKQTGSWERFGDLVIPRSRCIVAVYKGSVVCIGGQGENTIEMTKS